MNKLEVTVNGVTFENPFIVGSGPPSTNAKTIARSFDAGWGGSVLKTMSLDHSKVKNVAPRFGHMKADGKTIGFTNIELISDRPLDTWLEEIKQLKKRYPTKVIVASIMEEPKRENWQELTQKVCQAGSDLIELNLSCPHGMPERKMGQAMGQCPEIVKDVTTWVKEVSTVPVWAKMTPNITDITVPARAALAAGADGITAINTILSIAGIDLKTFAPTPSVKGIASFGGYSYKAIKPIGLRMIGELAMEFPQTILSGVGGITDAQSSAEYLCMGSSTLQVCTAIMLDGFKIIEDLKNGLMQILDQHKMDNVLELRGKSLPFFGAMSEMAARMDSDKLKKQAHTDAFAGDNIVDLAKGLSQ